MIQNDAIMFEVIDIQDIFRHQNAVMIVFLGSRRRLRVKREGERR